MSRANVETKPTLVLSSQEGAVRILTLNRSESLNAFSTLLLVQLRQALESAAQDPSVRALVLTGTGRGFSAGQDLKEPIISPDSGPDARPKDVGHLLDNYYIPLALRLRSMPMPVVCAVNGVAAGEAVNLALGCDIVIAAESARFIQSFTKLGLVPGCGGTWLLPRLVGRARALQMVLLGDAVSASEAAAIGLIAQCVPDEQLAETALRIAQRLAAMPTRALVETRGAVDDALTLDYEDALKIESLLQSQQGFAADFKEGASAFIEKRPASFKER